MERLPENVPQEEPSSVAKWLERKLTAFTASEDRLQHLGANSGFLTPNGPTGSNSPLTTDRPSGF